MITGMTRRMIIITPSPDVLDALNNFIINKTKLLMLLF